MPRRTRKELAAENALLLAELEAIRDQIDDLLDAEESDDSDAKEDTDVNGGDETTDDADHTD